MGPGKMTVAAIIPVYNQRTTVCEAIDSILAQSRPPDEIVVVDDGSTDGSGALVAERYAGKLRIIRQENRGAAGAFNRGIRETHSDLIALLGADDKWFPQRLERHMEFMEGHPDCMLSFSAHVSYYEARDETRTENTSIDKSTYVRKAFFREEALPAGNGVMVRREVFDEVGYFDESLRKCQDTDMWLRIMLRFEFEHIPEPLVWVRRGEARTIKSVEEFFPWQDRYFAKHRYTFGRSLRGQAIWRAGYASVLRQRAYWYLSEGRHTDAWRPFLKSLSMWPFLNPSLTVKILGELVLGTRLYTGLTSLRKRSWRRK